MRRLTAILAVSGLLLAACGGGGGVALPGDPGAVVLQVRSEGGFAPVALLINRPPRYTLTAGGELIFERPAPAGYPGPLLVGMSVTRLDGATMSRILEVVDAMGLAGIDSEANTDASSRVADATTEVVTYFDTEGGRHTFAVYALGLVDSSDPRVSRFEDLMALLDEAAASGESRPYDVDRLQVWVGPSQAGTDDTVDDVRPWPLPQDFDRLTPVFAGWRCAVYDGADRDRLLDVFSDATTATRWRSGEAEYTFLARPLLPGEEPCASPAES